MVQLNDMLSIAITQCGTFRTSIVAQAVGKLHVSRTGALLTYTYVFNNVVCSACRIPIDRSMGALPKSYTNA